MRTVVRSVAAGAAVLLAATLTACSSPAGAASTTKLSLSIPDPITSSVGVTAQHFAQQVQQLSHGTVRVTVIPNGTSFGGDQTAAVTRLGNGSLDGVILSTSVFATSEAEMNAISLPYLFRDANQEATYLDGAPGRKILDGLGAIKVKGLALLTRTPREITNSKRPITAPADLKGLKIRVPNNPLWTQFFSALGASPTPMNFSEVYTALQTGTIDGQENAVEVPATNKLYEVQRYISLTNHMSDAFVLALSRTKWQSLPADAQKVLQSAASETAGFKTKQDATLEQQQLKELTDHGMKVNSLSPAGLEGFQKTAKALYPSLAKFVGGSAFLKTTTDFVAAH